MLNTYTIYGKKYGEIPMVHGLQNVDVSKELSDLIVTEIDKKIIEMLREKHGNLWRIRRTYTIYGEKYGERLKWK